MQITDQKKNNAWIRATTRMEALKATFVLRCWHFIVQNRDKIWEIWPSHPEKHKNKPKSIIRARTKWGQIPKLQKNVQSCTSKPFSSKTSLNWSPDDIWLITFFATSVTRNFECPLEIWETLDAQPRNPENYSMFLFAIEEARCAPVFPHRASSPQT